MGFTAINDPPAASSTRLNRHPSSADSHAAGPRTIASEYLGRGQAQPTILPVSASSSKKVTVKGKKRPAGSRQSSKTTKRRKSSNVHDTLRVTKTQSSTDPLKSEVASASPAGAAKPKKKAARAASKPTSGEISTTVGDSSHPTTKSIPVYAPSTSMDALRASSARTSVDSLKANAGQSCTVYQEPSSSMSHPSVVPLPQPWPSETSDSRARTIKKSFTVLNSARGSSQMSSDALGQRTPSAQVSSVLTQSAAEQPDTAIRRSGRSEHALDHSVKGQPGNNAGNEVPRQRATLPSTAARRRTISSETLVSDDGFGRIDDEDLLESAMSIDEAIVRRPDTPPPRGRKQNMRDVDEHEDYGGALLTLADVKLLEHIKTKEDVKNDIDKPIVRKPFPAAIQDRSPIFGASNTALLRTCFRLGEALNAGSQAARCKKDVVLELYARVTSSWRDPKPGRKQHFVFKDLYHGNPPHLEGIFELWDQAQLWDLDTCPFLKATERGMIARVIAKMRRDGVKWSLEVLSMYEATWDDVNFVAGICSGHVHEDADEDVDA